MIERAARSLEFGWVSALAGLALFVIGLTALVRPHWTPFTAMVIAILGVLALGASRLLRVAQVSGNSPT